MDVESVSRALVAVLAPLGTIIGIGSRRRRLRNEIRDNLALIRELEDDDVLRTHTPVTGWLQGKIAVDVARLVGHELGTPKKPIPWSSIVFAGLLGLGFGIWTYLIVEDGFVWYATFPGVTSALMAVSIFGMLTNRELPPEESALPPGALPLDPRAPEERISASVHLAASGDADLDERFEPNHQVGVVLRFVQTLREGRYVDALELADKRWQLCRIQSWLWNNRHEFGSDIGTLEELADSLVAKREPAAVWEAFVASESAQFAEAWRDLDPNTYGAASRRRRLSEDHELVVLAPVGDTGGYMVTGPTALPNALTFVVRHSPATWLVANHAGPAAPVPGWPPTWWSPHDPAIDELPEPT